MVEMGGFKIGDSVENDYVHFLKCFEGLLFFRRLSSITEKGEDKLNEDFMNMLNFLSE